MSPKKIRWPEDVVALFRPYEEKEMKFHRAEVSGDGKNVRLVFWCAGVEIAVEFPKGTVSFGMGRDGTWGIFPR